MMEIILLVLLINKGMIKIKGYTPKLYNCKKEIELLSKDNPRLLELGMVQETCNCKNGQCERKNKK